MRFTVVVPMILLLSSGIAFAASPDCMKTASSQAAMNECVGQAVKASDKALNETYRDLLKKSSTEGATQLRKAQRAWLVWRDRQCAFETTGTRGGSFRSSAYAMCINDLTQQQSRRLDSQLHCQEGDLACGSR